MGIPRMSQTRVMLFVASFSGGGAERMTVNIANGLDPDKYTVCLLVLSNSGALKNTPAKHIHVKSLNENCEELNPYRNIRKILKIQNFIKKFRPNVILSNGSYCNIIMILANFLVKNHPRLLIRETNISVSIQSRRKFGFLKIIGYQTLYRFASVFIAPSNAVLEDFQEKINFGKCKQKVISNFVNSDYIDLKKNEEGVAPKVMTDNVANLVSIGRLVSQKDFATGLRAFRKIREVVACRYFILGEGPIRQELQILAKNLRIDNDVYFLGFQHNPYPILFRANVLLHPAKFEGFPNVILEAFYLGVPVVATNFNSSATEIVMHPEKGKVVNVGEDKEIAISVLRILNDLSHTEIIKNNINIEKIKYTCKNILPEYESLLQQPQQLENKIT